MMRFVNAVLSNDLYVFECRLTLNDTLFLDSRRKKPHTTLGYAENI